MFDGLGDAFAMFLVDDDRAVKLTTAKLFVTLAQSEPGAVIPAVDSLAGRLADDEEFYYVRARCAEALGYLALEAPAEVGDPEILADLRIGLSFDKPEVKEKLAKALSYVALGNPSRLRHQVASLADHLDDEQELVRYHLCTAVVVVGYKHPEKLSDATSVLRERIDDDNPYVRGRAAEGLALLVRNEGTDSIPDSDVVETTGEDPPSFLTTRLATLRDCTGPTEESVPPIERIGALESIREETDDIAEKITSPDGSECLHCGLDLPEDGPPICPRCGTPLQ
ncbi:hypothetical protein ACFQJ7_09465 [Halovenus rubra]|uniref:HEAT repeat protein n=2 Tax=Halovenus rubra TaxID=869890 RepID=A0ABD5X9L7_9EURY